MKFEYNKVLVIGAGKSGIAAVELLDRLDAHIVLYDGNKNLDMFELKKKLPQDVEIDIIVGDIPNRVKNTIDLVVISPGVPTDMDFVEEFAEKGIPIWGEIELAYFFSKGSIVAITGTNGKTTTTALTGSIMKEYFESVFVAGNIGIPYTQIVTETKKETVTVIEVSSFQLDTIRNFKPDVSVILNITPDHLDRHHTMENYIHAKQNITINQEVGNTCILNYEDEVLREFGKKQKAQVIYFSSRRELDEGMFLRDEDIVYKEDGKEIIVCNIRELKLLGLHNYENIMAAVGAAIAMNVPMELIRKAVIEFKSVEHRIEFVAEKNGVSYYNDSKGTNPDAAIKAVQAMVAPTILIAGGYDKNSEYEEWINSFDNKVKCLILIGQTKEKISETARKCGFQNITFAETLGEAVEQSKKAAEPGDAVLLSPACASWGMFKNYEERGNQFKEFVHAIQED